MSTRRRRSASAKSLTRGRCAYREVTAGSCDRPPAWPLPPHTRLDLMVMLTGGNGQTQAGVAREQVEDAYRRAEAPGLGAGQG